MLSAIREFSNSPPPLRVINPTRMTEEDKAAFATLIQNFPNVLLFAPYNPYGNIRLTHYLLRRKCSSLGRENEHRYEVMSGKILETGVQSQIFSIEGTIALHNNTISYKTKPRLVKAHFDPDAAKYEYFISKQAGHLHIKKPTFVGSRSFTVLRRFPKMDLHDALEEGLPASTDTRIDLVIAILNAVKRLHDKKIIHRDLKPENIIVDFSNFGILVTIIDFGLAKILGKKAPNRVGTIGYAAPEALLRQANFSSDIYSLAVIISLIFNGPVPPMPDRNSMPWDKIPDFTHKYPITEMFSDINDLDPPHRETIIKTVYRMHRWFTEVRMTLDEALAAFKQIQLERQNRKKDSPDSKSSVPSSPPSDVSLYSNSFTLFGSTDTSSHEGSDTASVALEEAKVELQP